jgi:CoA:oxalate CoA-transferase
LAPHPLTDLRVLDLSRVVSGPFAGRMLADLGADVVKVEPPEGDVTRVWGEIRHGLSGFYTQQNAGKRNVSVDLRAPGGPSLVARLARQADVVIENFRPGVLARYGLAWDDLSVRNPGLVMLSITGFGQDGPWRERQTYAPVVHAESGLLERQGRFDQASPSDPMLSIADTDAALHGLVAVLAALLLRQRTGQGQHVDLAMLDAMLATDDYAHHALDGSPVRRLGGETWEATGGPVLIAGDFRYVWRQVTVVHQVADPTPAGSTLEEKIGHRRRAFAEWLVSFGDRRGLVAALEAANLAWADVRRSEEAFDSPPARSRGVAADVDDRGGGRRRVVQSPYRFSAAASGVRAGAPRHGEHNGEVLGEWLGLGEEEVAALTGSGVLRSGGPGEGAEG